MTATGLWRPAGSIGRPGTEDRVLGGFPADCGGRMGLDHGEGGRFMFVTLTLGSGSGSAAGG